MVVPRVFGKSQGMNQVMDTVNRKFESLRLTTMHWFATSIAGLVGVQSDME